MPDDLRDIKRPITDADRNRFATEYYGWMEGVLRNKLGRGAEEYAGVAMWNALLCYDVMSAGCLGGEEGRVGRAR